MLNQNRNFRVTILNPERSIKYDGFKIRAFADQQNYQKYLFFFTKDDALERRKKGFLKKTFVVKVVYGHIIYFNIVFPKIPLKDNMLRFYHFHTSVRLVWRAEGTWQFRKKDPAVLNFEICHLLFDLTW